MTDTTTPSPRRRARSLAQLKLDAKRKWKWPYAIDHPNDERAMLEGCYPDFAAAQRVRGFFEDLLYIPRPAIRNKMGIVTQRGGVQPFVMLNWWFDRIFAPVFGWKRFDGRRRFDKAFTTTAKKSAKSTMLSGTSLYMTTADGEQEAEAYASATARDQAGIIFKKCRQMVRHSHELREVLTVVPHAKRIVHEESGSYFEAISAEADSAEGKNPHLLVADELHVWKNRQFFNALMYGDIAREQPLFWMITTAGEDRLSVGFEEYEFAKDLLNPNSKHYSMSHFAFIAEAGDDVEWDDAAGWVQANPSILEGVGSIEKLQAKCDEAKRSPRKKREFIRYICNRWVDSVEDPWITEEDWARGNAPIADHSGKPVWGGLDLSKSVDLTALCLAAWDGDFLDLWWHFWMPKRRVKKLSQRDRAPYQEWIEKGFITPTPGRVVDYAYIRRTISGVVLDDEGKPKAEKWPKRLDAQFKIQQIAIDPWNATKLATELGEYDGIPIHEMRQGFASMNEPSKALERLILEGKVRHGGNPVAEWMFGHAIVDTDAAENIKPSKKKSRHKIDGVVTAVMAAGQAIAKTGKRKRDFYLTNKLEIG